MTIFVTQNPGAIGPAGPAGQPGPNGPPIDVLIAPAMGVSPAMLLPLASDVKDVTANANNGTMQGAETHGPGRYGIVQALTFNGTNNYVTTNYAPFAPGGNQRTFFGWAYRTNHAAANTLLGGSLVIGCPALFLTSTAVATVTWTAQLGVDPTVTWVGAWPGDAQWVHWALVVDTTGQTVSFYSNGVLAGGTSKPDTTDYLAGDTLWVGHSGNAGGGRWVGSMATFGVVESALNATQINLLAGRITGSKSANAALTALIAQQVANGAIAIDATS